MIAALTVLMSLACGAEFYCAGMVLGDKHLPIEDRRSIAAVFVFLGVASAVIVVRGVLELAR